MHRYDSLREKLVLPFLLLGFTVSVLLSLTTFALVAQLEDRAILRAMHVELESFQHRRSIKPEAIPVASTLLQGYFLPSEKLPQLEPAPTAEEHLDIRTIQNIDYSILSTRIDGKPFVLLYDRSYVKNSLANLALLLLLCTGLMSLLSLLAGMHLAGKLVRPIVRLLEDVSEKARQFKPTAKPIGFTLTDYPRNEIGRLVRELDQFSLRIYGFLQRESYFAADVSHELRTPVAVIRGVAEVLAEYPDLPDGVRQRLQTIHRQALRMTELLEAMLLLAREGWESAEHDDPSCAMAEVVRDAIADSQPSLAGRPVEIVSELQQRPILPVERSLAYVVISNLLRNACAHTHSGRITIRLDVSGFEISDTGVGIPEDRFPSLFERHSKGEESQGSGLGLSIVARVADMLDWQVGIDSQPGIGTTVRVKFADTASARLNAAD
jgi:signal transduction histidine kinase